MLKGKKRTSQIIKRRGKRRQKGIRLSIFRWLLGFSLLFIFFGVLAAVGVYFYLSEDLPKISTLEDYRPPIVTTIYADNNEKIAEFFEERRIVVPLSTIPNTLKQAFIAAEDSRFYNHQGIDILSIIRAFIKNIEAGAIVQGGSTITQQVTKSFLLTPERSYTRKFKEAILAYRIDKSFTKNEILFLYLNQIYLGHGAYGVEAASENYFGKTVDKLSLGECAILAGLPQAPSKYSPFKFPERAKQRQIYALNRMVSEGYITEEQAAEAVKENIQVKPKRNLFLEEVPYFTEYVRQYIEKKYGTDALNREGLQVYTTVNTQMQVAATQEIEKGLKALDKRQGYRGPIKHLEPGEIEAFLEQNKYELDKAEFEKGKAIKGVITDINGAKNYAQVRLGDETGMLRIDDMRWARKPDPLKTYYEDSPGNVREVLKKGDVIIVEFKGKTGDKNQFKLGLAQIPKAQGALLCIEAETGHVKAIVGGKDFTESQFNRAIQSQRQPGSAFKPIIYAAALDRGYTPATMLIDSPVVFTGQDSNNKWMPKNYKEMFYGPVLFREALAKSINAVTVKILQDIGVDYAIKYAKKLGIESNISRNLSIALGSSGVSLLELTKAYSVFANQGYLIEPVFITKITDRDGNVIEEAKPKKEKAIEKNTAFIMTSLLEGVVKNGTGQSVLPLNRPVAGKTGTTNDFIDAWFIGYTPEYITGTWVGFDDESPLGKFETGAKAASPIWLGFMQKVMYDKPVKVFQVPEGVVFSKIDAKTGLLPIPESANTIFECFKEGTVPTQSSQKQGSTYEPDDFFKSGL